jgi:hypothetical protein
MIYSGDINYNEPYFQYNGVRIVSPESFGPTAILNNPKVLSVILIAPESIDSTLVFVNTHQIIYSSGAVDVTNSTSSMSFSTLNNQEGFIVFSVLQDEAFAISQAETIVLSENSAGTVDVTIIPTA